MSVTNKISDWVTALWRVFRNEMHLIITDAGVLLFFIGLPLAYPIVYTLIYNPEVVRDLPVAVIDDSRTAASRELVRKMAASPGMAIHSYCTDLPEARALHAGGEVYGIVAIPSDYAKKIGRGEQAHISFFADASLLLRYRTLLSALTDIQIEMVSELTGKKIAGAGLSTLAGDMSSPIESKSNFLGDSEQGFASFVIPGIVILILQQSMLLGICLLGGTSRERRRANGGIDPRQTAACATATVCGKALTYTVFYIPLTIYIMCLIPEIFALPHYGNPLDYLLFILPMLLATAFLGQVLNYFMKERESAFIIIVFTSVIFLFLSGLTWPRYAMNGLWTWLGNCIPATWGVEGFIRINSNAATLPEVGTSFAALWILSAVYMLSACLVNKYTDVNEQRFNIKNGRS